MSTIETIVRMYRLPDHFLTASPSRVARAAIGHEGTDDTYAMRVLDRIAENGSLLLPGVHSQHGHW